MDFNNVKAIVDNRMCEPKDTEKEANKLAKHVIEKEENQKTPKKDTLKDTYMTAKEALDYGLIDEIIKK